MGNVRFECLLGFHCGLCKGERISFPHQLGLRYDVMVREIVSAVPCLVAYTKSVGIFVYLITYAKFHSCYLNLPTLFHQLLAGDLLIDILTEKNEISCPIIGVATGNG